MNKFLKHIGAISGLIAFVIILSACRQDDGQADKAKEPPRQFKLGQIVYKRLGGQKFIIIKLGPTSFASSNHSWQYEIKSENDEIDYVYEFELVEEAPTETQESRNEIRY